MRSRRAFCASALLFLLLFAGTRTADGYSVLTHEELIDLVWGDSIRPLLLERYPNLTPAELREARAYAYGGCVIQDLGYYPFGKEMFSDLLHYVRTGDFVRSLFRNSRNVDDLAFSIGALSHYYGDTIGHPEATDPSVALDYPALAEKYGPNVNYAEGPRQHVDVEFGFDINDISKHRVAPEGYLNHVGFKVPVPLLAKAFYETYGLHLEKVMGKTHRPTMSAYRFAVRSFLPQIAYAETLLYRRKMPPDVPSVNLDELNRQVAALAAMDHWSKYHGDAGFGTHILAGFLFITPKVGPLRDLTIRVPNQSSEQDYIQSLLDTTAALRQTLGQATHSGGLPNKDLDTGDLVKPGTYPLEDEAYADLLHEMTRNPASPIPYGIRRDLRTYFADVSRAKYLKAKEVAQVKADLPVLKTIPVRPLEPEGPLVAPAGAVAARAQTAPASSSMQ